MHLVVKKVRIKWTLIISICLCLTWECSKFKLRPLSDETKWIISISSGRNTISYECPIGKPMELLEIETLSFPGMGITLFNLKKTDQQSCRFLSLRSRHCLRLSLNVASPTLKKCWSFRRQVLATTWGRTSCHQDKTGSENW